MGFELIRSKKWKSPFYHEEKLQKYETKGFSFKIIERKNKKMKEPDFRKYQRERK